MRHCNICNLDFENNRVYSNHIRWTHKEVHFNKYGKCKFCGTDFPEFVLDKHEISCYKNPKNLKLCKNCNKTFSSNGNRNEFCGQVCAAIYNNSHRVHSETSSCERCKKEFKRRKGSLNTLCRSCRNSKWKKSAKKDRLRTKLGICEICGKEFYYLNGVKKVRTCSKDCYKKLASKNSKANLNCGGETNYKKYSYNGIIMDSSWEVEVAKFLDEKNIKWERSRKMMFWWTDEKGSKRRYYPDFFLPEYNVYLDPKNKFLLIKDDFKLHQVIKENNISLIYGLKDHILEEIQKISNGPVA